MTPIRTVIIEDTPKYVETIRHKLAENGPHVQVVGQAGSVDTAYALIRSQRPDLVFFDIEIDGGTSFDVLSRLRDADLLGFDMIFLTAYGKFDYATRAIEYSALAFLTKPLDSTELYDYLHRELPDTLDKAARQLSLRQQQQQVQVLLEALRQPELRTISFHVAGGSLEFVDIADICYLTAEGPITHVSLCDGRSLKAMRNLGKYEQMLTRSHRFFRIHDKTVVNLDVVRRYNHTERCLTLKDGTVLYASKLRGEALRAHFLRNEDPGDNDKGLLKRLLGRG